MKNLLCKLLCLIGCGILSSFAFAERLIYAPDKNMLVIAGQYSTIWYKKLNGDDTSWHKAQGLWGQAHFSAVIYADGMFEAIANRGTIWYSKDGITWYQGQNLRGNGAFKAITYTGKGFIAVGSHNSNGTGGIWSSHDGIKWTNRVSTCFLRPTSSCFFDLRAIASDGNNNIVAVGANGQYVYSNDGGRTLHSESLKLIGKDFHDVTYAKNKFVAVASDSRIYYSKDGKEWQRAYNYANFVSLNRVIYAPYQDKFIAVGDYSIKQVNPGSEWPIYKYFPTILESTDGVAWQNIPGGDNKEDSRTSLSTIAADNQGIYVGGYYLTGKHSHPSPNIFYSLPGWGYGPALWDVLDERYKNILPVGRPFKENPISSIVSLNNGILYAISIHDESFKPWVDVYTSVPYVKWGQKYSGLIWKKETTLD